MAEPLVLFPVSDLVTATSRTLDVGGRTFHTFAIVSNGFSGSLTIQGQYNSEGGAAWHNVRYWEFDPDTGIVTGPFIAPIVPPATGVRHYYVIDPWRVMRALKTVPHGGTIGVDYFPQPLDAGFLTLSGIGGTGGAGGGGGSTATVVQQDPDQLNSNALVWDSEGPVGPENPLPVSLGTEEFGLRPGESHIGAIGSDHFLVSRLLILPAEGNYSGGDVLSASTSAGVAFYLPDMARVPGGSGVISVARLRANTDATTAFAIRLLLFKANPIASTLNDNVALSIALADASKLISRSIAYPLFTDMGTFGYAEVVDGRFKFQCAGTEKGLWGVLITDTAETNEVAGMTIEVELEGWQD